MLGAPLDLIVGLGTAEVSDKQTFPVEFTQRGQRQDGSSKTLLDISLELQASEL